jgi:branched-chain amino acid transport system substrate-binding protein
MRIVLRRESMRSMFCLLAALLVLIGCRSDDLPVSTGDKVKIGVLASLSGDNQFLGDNGLLGIRLGIQLSPVFLTGNTPEIVVADDMNDPKVAKEAFNNLVNVEKVAAVLVLSVNQAMLAVVEAAELLETPVLSVISTHPDITEGGWVSQLLFDDKVQASVAAFFARDELLVESAAVFKDGNNSHSVILATEFAKRFRETGGSVEVIDYSSERADLAVIIKRLQSSRIETLYLPLQPEDIIHIKKRTDEADYNPEVLVGDGVLSQLLLSSPEDVSYLGGVYATDIYSNDLPPTKFGKKAIKRFGKNNDDQRTTFAAAGCEAASVLLSAMNSCGENTDRSCINRNLRNISAHQGLFGKIAISREGKAIRPVYINRIVGDKLKMLVTVY